MFSFCLTDTPPRIRGKHPLDQRQKTPRQTRSSHCSRRYASQCMLGYTHTSMPSACWDTHTPSCPLHAGIHTPCPVHAGIHTHPLAHCMLGYTHTLGRHTPGVDTPQAYKLPPPLGRHPLPDGRCSRRYASYWNAYLCLKVIGSLVRIITTCKRSLRR